MAEDANYGALEMRAHPITGVHLGRAAVRATANATCLTVLSKPTVNAAALRALSIVVAVSARTV